MRCSGRESASLGNNLCLFAKACLQLENTLMLHSTIIDTIYLLMVELLVRNNTIGSGRFGLCAAL
jgi:hypothetical protein